MPRLPDSKLPVGLAYALQPIEGPAPLKRKTTRSEGDGMAKKPMTKADMIAKVSKDADISKAAAKTAIESFVDMARKEVKVGRSFRVAGLGTFSLKKSKARKGINPSTGEAIKIKAKKRMAFKASAQVKNLLN